MSSATYAAEDVLVIGAGPAGIASAYFLKHAGISYRVIDRAGEIGSTWNSLYPSLRLNTTRFFSHMPGMRFPLHYGIFPSAKQYHAYLLEFVQRHQFNIHLNITVHRVTPEGNFWRVEASDGIWLYKTVIAATGIFGSPVMPQIDGMENFTGEMLHAHDFKHPDQVAGKRVLVVGNGPSGIDISVAAGNVAAATQIAIRTGINMYRRYPLGLPNNAWLMLSLLLPKAWCSRLMRFVTRLEYSDQEKYGLKKPAPGSGGITAYQGRELIEAVKAGKVQPVEAPVRFYGRCVDIADGSSKEFDTVIMATGYRTVLQHYLDIPLEYDNSVWTAPGSCDWQIGPNGQRGFPILDRSEHPNGRQVQGHPGLYVVGVYYKGKGAMYNFNVEAEIAAEQIQAYLAKRQSLA